MIGFILHCMLWANQGPCSTGDASEECLYLPTLLPPGPQWAYWIYTSSLAALYLSRSKGLCPIQAHRIVVLPLFYPFSVHPQHTPSLAQFLPRELSVNLPLCHPSWTDGASKQFWHMHGTSCHSHLWFHHLSSSPPFRALLWSLQWWDVSSLVIKAL